MEAAERIRKAVAQVSLLRQQHDGNATLAAAVAQVKRLQSCRFAGTYGDLLVDTRFGAAARFFLVELYSDSDYSERDAQFARIANAMQRFFPDQVVSTAVALAELHALTESLDHAMGQAWMEESGTGSDGARYVAAWRRVGCRDDREGQLHVVTGIGDELVRFTQTPGLRIMLKMMRGPAAAAGLRSLQTFLEAGFDTFAALAKRRGDAREFLDTIRVRETELISMLFDSDAVACETELLRILGQAR